MWKHKLESILLRVCMCVCPGGGGGVRFHFESIYNFS